MMTQATTLLGMMQQILQSYASTNAIYNYF